MSLQLLLPRCCLLFAVNAHLLEQRLQALQALALRREEMRREMLNGSCCLTPLMADAGGAPPSPTISRPYVAID